MTLHFAYGSNMSVQKMSKFAPSAEYVAVAYLPDWRFCLTHQWFDGSAKATIVPCPGERIWGVIFDLPPNDINQ